MAVIGTLSDILLQDEKNTLIRKGFHYLKSLPSYFMEKESPSFFQKVEIRGDVLFALNQVYCGREASEAKYESHLNYIDIQYIVSGTEMIKVCPRAKLKIETPYNPQEDIEFYFDQPGSQFLLTTGMLAIFYPEDAHAPGIAVGEGLIRKSVIKIKIKK
jgi:biofilm protein TabA